MHDAAVPARLDICRLIRELVLASGTRPDDLPASREHTVLLDTHVDDVRCILVREVSGSAASQVVLSPREREIVRMVAAGYPNKTIAGVLEISCWTVGTHLRRVFAKLGVGSRAAMIARLSEIGVATTYSREGPSLATAQTAALRTPQGQLTKR